MLVDVIRHTKRERHIRGGSRWWLVNGRVWVQDPNGAVTVIVPDVVGYLLQVELGSRVWRLWR